MYRALEPRIAFDAALATAVDQDATQPVARKLADTPAQPATEALSFDTVRALAQAIDEMAKPVPAILDARATIEAIASRMAAAPSVGASIVFIVSGVQGAAALAAAAPACVEIVMLNAGRDGVQQIAEYLRGRTDITATDIAAGKLIWTPAANANGAGLASFTFQVQDNGGTGKCSGSTAVQCRTGCSSPAKAC